MKPTRGLDGDDLTISTIHGVKGLEFEYVFLMKLNKGILPSFKAEKNTRNSKELEANLAEERRIAYVAMTRDKRGLYLSTSDGQEGISEFVTDVWDLLDQAVIDEKTDKEYIPALDWQDEEEEAENINVEEDQYSEEEIDWIEEDDI